MFLVCKTKSCELLLFLWKHSTQHQTIAASNYRSIKLSQHHRITESQNHRITESQHYITTSQHLSWTVSQHHSITVSQHHSITAAWDATCCVMQWFRHCHWVTDQIRNEILLFQDITSVQLNLLIEFSFSFFFISKEL